MESFLMTLFKHFSSVRGGGFTAFHVVNTLFASYILYTSLYGKMSEAFMKSEKSYISAL